MHNTTRADPSRFHSLIRQPFSQSPEYLSLGVVGGGCDLHNLQKLTHRKSKMKFMFFLIPIVLAILMPLGMRKLFDYESYKKAGMSLIFNLMFGLTGALLGFFICFVLALILKL